MIPHGDDYPLQEIQSDRESRASLECDLEIETRDPAKLAHNLNNKWNGWTFLIGCRTFIYCAASLLYIAAILPMPMVRPIPTTPMISPHFGWFIGAVGLWYLFDCENGKTISLRLARAKYHSQRHSPAIDSTSSDQALKLKPYLRGYLKYHRVKANNYFLLSAFTWMNVLTPIPFARNHLPIPAFIWGSIAATVVFWYKAYYHHSRVNQLKHLIRGETATS
jgi:hypothetical protein